MITKLISKVAGAVGLALMALLAVPCQAQLQVQSTNQNKMVELSIPSTIAANGTTNFCGNVPAFLINPGYGIALEWSATNAGSGALSNLHTFVFFTTDGSNYHSAADLSHVKTLNGSTAIRAGTNFPASLMDGYFGCQILVSNGDAANVIGFTDRKIRLSRYKLVPKTF